MKKLTADTVLVLDGGDRLTWEEFTTANWETVDLGDVGWQLQKFGRFVGGGGASPEWTVEYGEPEKCPRK